MSNLDPPTWTEEQIREAMTDVMKTIGDQSKIDLVILRLQRL